MFDHIRKFENRLNTQEERVELCIKIFWNFSQV